MPTLEQKSKQIGLFLNGTLSSIKTIIPVPFEPQSPRLLKQPLHVKYGVLIGFAGDIKGKLVIKGESDLFGAIGEAMYGMPLEGEMLSSFTGELGNMVTGGLSTQMSEKGTNIDITPPTVMEGEVTLSGFENSVLITVSYGQLGEMDIYLLIDQ